MFALGLDKYVIYNKKRNIFECILYPNANGTGGIRIKLRNIKFLIT